MLAADFVAFPPVEQSRERLTFRSPNWSPLSHRIVSGTRSPLSLDCSRNNLSGLCLRHLLLVKTKETYLGIDVVSLCRLELKSTQTKCAKSLFGTVGVEAKLFLQFISIDGYARSGGQFDKNAR